MQDTAAWLSDVRVGGQPVDLEAELEGVNAKGKTLKFKLGQFLSSFRTITQASRDKDEEAKAAIALATSEAKTWKAEVARLEGEMQTRRLDYEKLKEKYEVNQLQQLTLGGNIHELQRKFSELTAKLLIAEQERDAAKDALEVRTNVFKASAPEEGLIMPMEFHPAGQAEFVPDPSIWVNIKAFNEVVHERDRLKVELAEAKSQKERASAMASTYAAEISTLKEHVDRFKDQPKGAGLGSEDSLAEIALFFKALREGYQNL